MRGCRGNVEQQLEHIVTSAWMQGECRAAARTHINICVDAGECRAAARTHSNICVDAGECRAAARTRSNICVDAGECREQTWSVNGFGKR